MPTQSNYFHIHALPHLKISCSISIKEFLSYDAQAHMQTHRHRQTHHTKCMHACMIECISTNIHFSRVCFIAAAYLVRSNININKYISGRGICVQF